MCISIGPVVSAGLTAFSGPVFILSCTAVGERLTIACYAVSGRAVRGVSVSSQPPPPALQEAASIKHSRKNNWQVEDVELGMIHCVSPAIR